MDSVVLIATFDDASVRIRASTDAVLERARDLDSLGWRVEIRDDSGTLLQWDRQGGLRAPVVEPPAAAFELPVDDESDFPLPPSVDPGALREGG